MPLIIEHENSYRKKLTEIKGAMDTSTILEKSNIPFSVIDRNTQTVDKDIEDLSNNIHKLYIIDIYRNTPKHLENTYFFECTWIVTKIVHILGHKISVNKIFEYFSLTESLSDHNEIKLERNKNVISRKSPNL